MSTNAAINLKTAQHNVVEMAHQLGPVFEKRAEQTGNEDAFVLENFAELKASGLVEAGVPAQLGGGDADVYDLAEMLRILARHCGSTALAFAMHTHQVAIPAWRWTHQKATPVEPLLKRVAQEKLNESLRLEIETLKSLPRLEFFAKHDLHMIVPAAEDHGVIERVDSGDSPSSSVLAQR